MQHEQETGKWPYPHNEGSVERSPNVSANAGRAEDVPDHMPTMEQLLRQQHAVRSPVEAYHHWFFDLPPEGSEGASSQAPARDRNPAPRAWGLLLHTIRDVLEKADRIESDAKALRVYAQAAFKQYWEGHLEAKQSRSVDPVVRPRRGILRERQR